MNTSELRDDECMRHFVSRSAQYTKDYTDKSCINYKTDNEMGFGEGFDTSKVQLTVSTPIKIDRLNNTAKKVFHFVAGEKA